MMRERFKSFLKNCFILACIFITQHAQAQSMAEVEKRLADIRASIDGLMNAAITYIFQTPPNIGKEATNNVAIKTASPSIPPQIKKLNTEDIAKGLSPDSKEITERSIKYTYGIKGSDSLGSSFVFPAFTGTARSAQESAAMAGNENFDFQTLFDPDAYEQKTNEKEGDRQQDRALNFIRFAAGYGIPISNFNLNKQDLTQKEKETVQDSANYHLLSAQRRQLIAQQSAALSVLYSMYARRLPLENVKKNDTTLEKEKTSIMEIEKHIATWRTSDPKWYTQMATVSQTNVEREILFVLVEMQAQLHQMHRDNEQIIALLAISLLGAQQTNKTTIRLTEQLLIDDIKDMRGQKPPPNTAPNIQTPQYPAQTPQTPGQPAVP